jgi:D-alanyl-D-alanine carboxypeptidase
MKTRKLKLKPRFFIIVASLFLIVVLAILYYINRPPQKDESLNSKPISSSSISETKQEEVTKDEIVETKSNEKVYKGTYPPILVNGDFPLSPDFKPNIELFDKSHLFDKVASIALRDMIAAAENDGIKLFVISAYRSVSYQEVVFNKMVQKYKDKGQNEKDAHDNAAKYVAIPGTSEHALGLAVDLNSLEVSFEKTKEFDWLYKNCAKFGFILRYPKDKTQNTKINFEPWHYRYVGSTIATKIMKEKVCLEEYLGK